MKVIHGEWIEVLQGRLWEAKCAFGYAMEIVKNRKTEKYRWRVGNDFNDTTNKGIEVSLEKAKAKAEKGWQDYALDQIEKTVTLPTKLR
jgi:hypothetical protein